MEKLGVRKGVWTKEEDIRLTECIHEFGEGRWHLVPLRAGLNRCRKSCRLRWLNYLNPNVKRGLFTKDEVDLIVRMHKLLGNRWSWIAGRIPGRTANDIKNYWNTRMIHKKSSSAAVGESHCPNKAINTESSIIRPQPRTTFSCPLKLITPETNQQQGIETSDKNNEIPMNMLPLDDDKLEPTGGEEEEDEQVEEKECMRWWANLLEASKNENGARVPFSFPEDHDSLQEPPMRMSPGPGYQVSSEDSIINDGGGLCGFDLDEQDIWEIGGINNASSNNQ